MKKLMFLISTEGKSRDQIAKEAWGAYQEFSQPEKKIPKGFIRCEVCGEYNGETKMKNLSWGESCEKSSSENEISVSCLCRGILCRKCQKNNINRPVSNSYYEEDNTVWHHPYFAGMMPCRDCLKKIAKAEKV